MTHHVGTTISRAIRKNADGPNSEVMNKRTAIHEAAIATACFVLGLPIIKVTIADGESYLLRGFYRQQRDLAVEARCIMSLAGSEAEKLFFPGGNDDYFGDSIDLDAVRRYLRPDSELQFIAEVARLRAAARRLVEAERVKIEIIASALLRHGTLSGEAITDLLAPVR
jgi:hypothetical protein